MFPATDSFMFLVIYFLGLKCYSCEGGGSDGCVSDPAKVANETYCPAYQNCHVLRRDVTSGNSS